MIALLGAVLAASFLGSLHCLGMCGPLVAAGVAPLGATRAQAAFAHGLYHVGRLLTLALLGGLAGLIGAGVEDAGRLVGLQRLAAVAAGLLLIAWGAASLARELGAGSFHARLPWGLGERVAAALAWVNGLPDRRRALFLGSLTPFLPCGWLYLFALTAAGTGSAAAGAAVLVTFGLGNTPILLGLSLGVRGALARWRERLALASGALLIVVGSLLVLDRSQVILPAPRAVADAASQPGTGPQVPQAEAAKTLPCCGGEAAVVSASAAAESSRD